MTEQQENLGLASARIDRFKQLGGVDLARLALEEQNLLVPEIHTGVAPFKKAKFGFKCPLCANKASLNTEMPPLCTGPHPSLDEHEPTVMEMAWCPPGFRQPLQLIA